MPALNRCRLLAVPKQEQILLDRGRRAVNQRLTKVNGPSEAGPVTPSGGYDFLASAFDMVELRS